MTNFAFGLSTKHYQNIFSFIPLKNICLWYMENYIRVIAYNTGTVAK